MERAVLVQAASGSLMEVDREKGPSEGRATRKGGPHPQSHRGGKKTKATATACGDTSAPKRHRPQEGAIFLEQCSARSCCSKC